MPSLDLSTKETRDTDTFQLRDAKDELMFAGPASEGGEPVPVTVTVYGPGSKQYQAAQARAQKRMLEVLKKKGKGASDPRTTQERIDDTALQLADITHSFSGLSYQALEGRELALAIYRNPSLGYIAEQVNRHAADWANFTKG